MVERRQAPNLRLTGPQKEEAMHFTPPACPDAPGLRPVPENPLS